LHKCLFVNQLIVLTMATATTAAAQRLVLQAPITVSLLVPSCHRPVPSLFWRPTHLAPITPIYAVPTTPPYCCCLTCSTDILC